MDFVKEFMKRGNFSNGAFSCTITNERIVIKLPNKYDIKRAGLIQGGVGVIVEKAKKERVAYCTNGKYQIAKEDLPEQFRADGYIYRITTDKISEENEIVFDFKNAIMLNKK